jgi:hypothetical protein
MGAPEKYDMTVYPTAGLVRSASDGARSHQVTLPSCDCGDFINRKGWVVMVDGVPAVTICKHIAEFIERAGGWHRQPAEPEVHEGLTRNQASEILNGIPGVTPAMATNALSSVNPGHPHFLARYGLAAVEVRVAGSPRRYFITIPA